MYKLTTPRILMVIASLRLNKGGAERQMLRLSDALIKKGLSVMIVAGAYPKEEGKTVINDMVIFRNRIWGIKDKKGNYRFGSYTYMMTLFFFLFLHRKEYDIIHVHIAGHNAAMSALAARLLKKGLVVKIASSGKGSDLLKLQKAPLFGPIFLNQMKRADRIVAINPMIKNELLEYGFNPKKIVEIPNGIDSIIIGEHVRDKIRSSLNIQPSSRVVIFTGTFKDQKNIEILVESWEMVVSEIDDALLIMLGDGPKYEYVKKAGEKIEGIIIPGRVSNVYEYLSAADIFVLPSKYEGLSNSLLEAMSVGLMPVVSDIPGNIRLIADEGEEPKSEGDTRIYSAGIAVEGDPRSLARGLIMAIKDTHRGEKITENAKKRVTEHFNINNIADSYIDLYSKIAHEKELNTRKG